MKCKKQNWKIFLLQWDIFRTQRNSHRITWKGKKVKPHWQRSLRLQKFIPFCKLNRLERREKSRSWKRYIRYIYFKLWKIFYVARLNKKFYFPVKTSLFYNWIKIYLISVLSVGFGIFIVWFFCHLSSLLSF